jgi:hypothetical protein
MTAEDEFIEAMRKNYADLERARNAEVARHVREQTERLAAARPGWALPAVAVTVRDFGHGYIKDVRSDGDEWLCEIDMEGLDVIARLADVAPRWEMIAPDGRFSHWRRRVAADKWLTVSELDTGIHEWKMYRRNLATGQVSVMEKGWRGSEKLAKEAADNFADRGIL